MKQRNKKPPRIFCADFETTTKHNFKAGDVLEKPLEVWLACYVDTENKDQREKYVVDTDINSFFYHLTEDVFAGKNKNNIVFFHNLRFDGSYIIQFFEEKNIEYETFINEMGVWYEISYKVYDEHNKCYKIKIKDSLKLLQFTIKEIGEELLGGKVTKGETPLLEEKPKEILAEWIEYVKTDVEILAQAIYLLFHDQGYTKYTSSSEALKEYKETIGGHSEFIRRFPILDSNLDKTLREGYRGGFTYCQPQYQNRIIEAEILEYDKNSMYPSIMLNYPLPYGYPIEYQGYKEPEYGKCYIYVINCLFDLRPEHIPSIQIRTEAEKILLGNKSKDYLHSSQGLKVHMVVTEWDLKLMQEQYYLDIDFITTYEFNSSKGMFDTYIDKFRKQKIEAVKEGNTVKKLKAKLMLNGLYGKFGTKVVSQEKTPYIDSNGVLRFAVEEPEMGNGVYLPIAIFVTSIGRYEVIHDAQRNYKYFLYSDTDSIHLIKHEGIDLKCDKYELGYWDIEYTAVRGKYIRPKLYIEEKPDGELIVRGAGMSDEIKAQVTFDNFNIGQTFTGKKSSMQVNGGMLIYETEFTIGGEDDLTVMLQNVNYNK